MFTHMAEERVPRRNGTRRQPDVRSRQHWRAPWRVCRPRRRHDWRRADPPAAGRRL